MNMIVLRIVSLTICIIYVLSVRYAYATIELDLIGRHEELSGQRDFCIYVSHRVGQWWIRADFSSSVTGFFETNGLRKKTWKSPSFYMVVDNLMFDI